MVRFLILFGFMFLFLHLHSTGDIRKYINMKYAYLSFIMIFVFAFLTVYQVIKWNREGKGKFTGTGENDNHSHAHTHADGPVWKKVLVYSILIFPLLTGILLPIATLDSNIVKAKGFHFAMIDNDKDQYSNHEILRPDTSLYYGQEEYRNMLSSDLKKYSATNNVILKDSNFLHGLETIYNYPGSFINKNVSLSGFVYHGDALNNHQLFLFRFGIIHCIADAGVFGMMVEFPKDVTMKDDEWLQVEGELSTVYYQPFKQTIPYLKVTKWNKINPPKDPYVYRQS